MKILNLSLMAFWVLLFNSNSNSQNIVKENDENYNRITFSYSLDSFSSKYTPWNQLNLEYEKRFSAFSIIPRINYSNRFDISDWMMEFDSYIFFSKNTYSYLNAGISDNKIFPHYRFGIEPYQNLPEAFEISIGFRYLSFSNTDIGIYTGSIGKYVSDYWISFRPFIVPESDNLKVTYNLITRKYFADKFNYLSLKLGWGKFPNQELTVSEINLISSKSVGIAY